MEFLAPHYEDTLLDYSFIRAIGVQGVHLKFIAALSMKFNRKGAC